MVYTVTTFDPVGQTTFTIADQAVDGQLVLGAWTGQTPITLIGHGALNYGQGFDQSLINLLENFASLDSVQLNLRRPLVGQIWFNKTDQSLRINTGTPSAPVWTVIGPPTVLGFTGVISALGYTPVNKVGDTMTGTLNLGAALNVTGNTSLTGNVSTNSLLVNATLQVVGVSTLVGGLNSSGAIHTANSILADLDITASHNLVVGGTVSVGAGVGVASGLTVTGTTTLNGGLTVTGTISATSTVNASGFLIAGVPAQNAAGARTVQSIAAGTPTGGANGDVVYQY